MIRKLLIVAVAAALVGAVCSSSIAIPWAKVGSSAFTTASGPMMDRQRIKINSVAVDGLGNVYATANNVNNDGAAGGLTIYKTNGSKLNIDVNALGFPGGITKLLMGGDGCIYALQNWLEIGYSYNKGVNRILKIDPFDNFSVSMVYSPGPASDANRIGGMTVGRNGDIYFTNNCNQWKTDVLWVYHVASGTYEHSSATAGTNNGWGQNHRMFDLEYVGDPTDSTDNTFALVNMGSPEWAADPMGWTVNRALGAPSNPGWGRDWITAMVYDPVNRRLWAGGRGAGGNSTYNYNYAGTGIQITHSFIGDNHVLLYSKPNTAKSYYSRASLVNQDKVMSMAMRFRVDSYTSDFDGAFLVLAPQANSGGSPTCILKIRSNRFILTDLAGVQTADLGPVDNEFHEVYFSVNGAVLPRTAECWFDGVAKTVTAPGGGWASIIGGPKAYFGAGVAESPTYAYGGQTGASAITMDWVAFAKCRVTPGMEWPLKSVWDVNNAMPDNKPDSTNIMTYWEGAAGSTKFFGASVPATVGKTEVWHANGNIPPGEIDNGDDYWVNTLAVNPVDGNCWMAWGAEPAYSFGDRGHVLVRTPSLEFYDMGLVEAGSDVVGLAFDGGNVYASTYNHATGAFSLYRATPPASYLEPVGIAEVKQRGVGNTVQMGSSTNPLVVTFTDPAYYYVEETRDGHAVSGIKVISTAQPSVGTLVSIKGVVTVLNHEAAITPLDTATYGSGSSPIPVGVRGNCLGGGQIGMQPAVAPSTGPNNVGLLVKMVGRVKALTDPDAPWMTLPFFTIQDDTPAAATYYVSGTSVAVAEGIKVALDGGFVAGMAEGSMVAVTGVLSTDLVSGNPADLNSPKIAQRVIRPRSTSDVVVF